MLPKTPAAVGCAHCHHLVRAVAVCPSCGRALCAACLADLSRCPDPAPREVRLGMGARLREVDPSGRFGLVTTWRMARRIIDLSKGDQHQAPLVCGSGAEILSARVDDIVPWPCPLPSGGLVALVRLPGFEGLYVWNDSPVAGSVRPIVVRSPEWKRLPKRLCLSEDGALVAVARDDEVVEVIEVGSGHRLHVVTEPGHVVHAIGLSRAAGLIALGAYGRVVFFRLTDGARVGAARTSHGNLRWVGLGRGVVGTLTEHGAIELLRIEAGRSPSRWRRLRCPTAVGREARGPAELSLSSDGRFLAGPDQGHDVVAFDIERRTQQRLRGHTDRVNLVRFVGEGRALITADHDNRVIIWPRRGDEIASQPQGPCQRAVGL